MTAIKVYVSLPITGQESTVMKRCLEAKERLEKIFKEADTQDYELEVVFPKDVDKIGTTEQDNTKPLGYWIGEDIKLLMECDAVYFCKGYSKSRGCQLEHRCASLYQKTILNQCYPIDDNVFELEELVDELDLRAIGIERRRHSSLVNGTGMLPYASILFVTSRQEKICIAASV